MCHGSAGRHAYSDENYGTNSIEWSAVRKQSVDRGILSAVLHVLEIVLSHLGQITTSTTLLFLNDCLGLVLLRYSFICLTSFSPGLFSQWREDFIQRMFDFASMHVPMVKRMIEKEEGNMERYLVENIKDPKRTITRVLPKIGRNYCEVLTDLETRAAAENAKWEKGLVSGAVYSGEQSHTSLLSKVYAIYSLANPLHIDIWPSINQCEAEVVSMTANLLNGGEGTGVVGATTSGGTESIILAIRSHLEVYGKKRGIFQPEIVCSTTAHAAVDKACEMFGIKLIKIPCCSKTFQLNPINAERKMSSNTILIFASAPSFPQGVIDSVEKLAELALRYNVGMHVDCCLGGFVLPFARMLGKGYAERVPKFDFECRGVTSISVDTHKYGYASKGTSVVLYRNKTLRRAQYFNFGKWSGGLYSTPTISGSRPGALLACAWASLITMGESGYKSRVKIILDATQRIGGAVSNIPGLCLLGGSPHAMIVCFASDNTFDIYDVGEKMAKIGWSLNSLQSPPCIHLCVTLKTADNVEKFIKNLSLVVKKVREESKSAGKKKRNSSAAIYGMAGTMPAGPVNELLKVYTDVTLSC